MYVIMLCSKSVEHRIREGSSFPYIDISPECQQNHIMNPIIKSKLVTEVFVTKCLFVFVTV